MDFGKLKSSVQKEVIDILDHSVAIYGKDTLLLKAIQGPFFRTILFPYETTVENVCSWIAERLLTYHLNISKIVLWKTPTSKVVLTL